MKSTLVRWGAVALLVGTFAGCGGGGGSDSTAAAPAAGGGAAAAAAPAGAPAGTAVITAAAASPATTNTAANPDQAFGLIAAVGAAPVTVQSPPVVNFTVIDSTGKFVPGLILANTAAATSAAATAADANCSGSNVTFAMSQWTGTYWQSLISRQRLAANSKTQFSVMEGTTDPKPTAGGQSITKADGTKTTGQLLNADDAAAIADPSKRLVGVLKENTAGGYYTYYFATDVVKPLAMADAVDVQGITQGKVANNGNVALKDGKTIHRIGAQLCFVDPATQAKVVVNPVMDFTLNADGTANPVKAADGKTPALSRQVVTKDSCNECHQTLAAHGTRVEPAYCVNCHNPGSTDYNTNNPIDFRVLVHRIHMGPELTKDYKVASYVARGTDASGNVTGTGYPQNIQNCTKCHDGSATAVHPTAQGDNWLNAPSRAACGSCHDGINFATGKGLTLADNAKGLTVSQFGHVGGIQTDDKNCALCHGPTAIPTYHPTVTPPADVNSLLSNTLDLTLNPPASANSNSAWVAANPNNLPAGAIKISYDISSVSVNASGNPVIVFRILQNGARADLKALPTAKVTTGEIYNNFMGAPSVYFVYSVPQDGITAPADFNVSTSGYIRDLWRSGDTKQFSGPDANGYYTAVVTSNKVPTSGTNKAVMVTGGVGYTYTLPSVSRTTGVASAGTPPLTQTNLTDYPLTASTVPGLSAYSWGGLIVVAQDQKMVATGYTGRRVIVDDAKCDKCHMQLGAFTADAFHAGQRNDAPTCAFCHKPNQTSSGWSASSGYFIHAIHGGQKRQTKFTWHASSTIEGSWDVEMPASLSMPNSGNNVLRNCETCHVAGMYDYSNSATTAAYPNMLWPTVGAGLYPASGVNLPTYALNTAKTTCVQALDSAGAPIFSTGNALSVFSLSPYVLTSTAVTGAGANNYGVGFTFNGGSSAAPACLPDGTGTPYSVAAGATREADGTTLVISPFVATCVSCHDGKNRLGTIADAKTHMTQNGGTFYKARSSVYATGSTSTLANAESCLLCHGSSGVAAISAMHKR